MRRLCLMLAACAWGCGDGSRAQDAGGADATADTAVPTDAAGAECSIEVTRHVVFVGTRGPSLGFRAPPDGEEAGTVRGVSAEQVTIEVPGAGGLDAHALELKWRGRDLSELLSEDDPVTASVAGEWDVLQGPATRVAVFTRRSSTSPGTEHTTVPEGGPELTLRSGCRFADPTGGCGQPPAEVLVFEMEGTLGSETLLLAPGETGSLGAWELSNVLAVQHPGYTGPGCDVEPVFAWIVTAAGG